MTSGMIDILLNALFIIVFGWGIVGAAVSTVIGQMVGSIVPMSMWNIVVPFESEPSHKPQNPYI